MKRYPEFIYNAIDKQNIVYANQLKMSDWNNIINVLKTQANANTTFLETWTRWFFGPKEYIDEEEYATIPDNYTNYFDYLTSMFKEIDTRIKKEINDRTAADDVLRNYIDLNHGIAMGAISEETQQRILSDSALGSRIDTEKERIDSVQKDLSDEISARVSKDEMLSNQITELDNKKINKDFTGLSVAHTIHSDDTVIVRCAGCDGNAPVTYTIKIKTLMELMNSEVDYFKGYHKDISTLPTPGEPGDYAFVGSTDADQYHMYVWDERDGGVWEETISGQYVLTSSFELFQQRLREGSIYVGSIKGNVNNVPANAPELTNLLINDTSYVMPSTVLELSESPKEGAPKISSMTIDGNEWNINNDSIELEFSDEQVVDGHNLGSISINGESWNVGKTFTPLMVGSRLYKGEKLTKDLVESKTQVSDIYKFSSYLNGNLRGYYTIQFNKAYEGKFNHIFTTVEGNSQIPFDAEELGVVGDYWEVVEITAATGYRFGRFSEIGAKLNQLAESKLNKEFNDLVITSDLSLTDYFVINQNGAPYRITLDQLQRIISQKTNFFKGQYSSLEHLTSTQFPDGLNGGDYAYVDTEFTNDDGSKYYQFVMYVWDVEDSRWEQTASSQYLGVTTFQAFQESLLNGTFQVGSIKGNAKLSGDNPILTSLEVNGVVYALPSVKNQLTAGEGISISEDGVISVTFTPPTAEQWDGSYEEIVSGFTLTLQGSYPYEFKYSLDGGNTYTTVSSLPTTIENVSKIKFRTEAGDLHAFNVGTSDGAYDITGAMKAGGYGETDEVNITANATWYISKGNFSGGAD